MPEEKVLTEHDVHTNEFLAMPVIKDSELKAYLVDYVGNKINPENEEVTVNMIVEVMAAEFPEFVFGFAEENFLRGYQTGLNDAENLFRTTTETDIEETE
tara:strand:- start:102 stop:401 length:300 start_codon:yes stop_codon:yes gene_type:complete